MLPTVDTTFNAPKLSDVQILAVDNHIDSTNLYTALLESCGAIVTAAASIDQALVCLDQSVPDILICEFRYLGERVCPLIQQIRYIARSNYKVIPVFVTSTFLARDLAKHLEFSVEAYHTKPIDVEQFVNEVASLVLLSRTLQPLTQQNWLASPDLNKTSCCCRSVQ